MRTSVHIQLHPRTYKDVRERAKSEGVSVQAFVSSALLYALRRDEFTALEFKECHFTGKDGAPMETIMDALAGRKMILADIVPRGSEQVSASVRRALYRALPRTQAVRVERHMFLGEPLELIGQREGVSKQAVHTSVQRAMRTLRSDRGFLDALVALFPEAGLSTSMLLEAQS